MVRPLRAQQPLENFSRRRLLLRCPGVGQAQQRLAEDRALFGRGVLRAGAQGFEGVLRRNAAQGRRGRLSHHSIGPGHQRRQQRHGLRVPAHAERGGHAGLKRAGGRSQRVAQRRACLGKRHGLQGVAGQTGEFGVRQQSRQGGHARGGAGLAQGAAGGLLLHERGVAGQRGDERLLRRLGGGPPRQQQAAAQRGERAGPGGQQNVHRQILPRRPGPETCLWEKLTCATARATRAPASGSPRGRPERTP